jgi:protein-tyrosine phosphatase
MSVLDVRTPVRLVPLSAAFNLRDLGGYRTADGRVVAWGRLYRSDQLHGLTGRDLDLLRSLGLRTVLDLRTEGELADGRFPVESTSIAFHHLPLLAQTWYEEEVDALADLLDRAVPYLVARYLDMLEEAGPVLAAAVDLVARPGTAPLLFHCAAGKDRTGVLAAVLLRTLGVVEPDVVEDYVLSADAMARRLAWLQGTNPTAAAAMAAQPAGWLAAPAEVMRTVLHHLEELHGGAAGYLVDHGLDPAAVDELRHALLT